MEIRLLVGILAGFLPCAVGAASWTQFKDPKEDAFTIAVPEGWQVVGGIARRSASQAYPIVGVLSPDQLTKIEIGDPAAIAYAENGPMMRATGFREGQSYSPRGEPEIVMNYRNGTAWSRELAQKEASSNHCIDIKVVAQRDLPATRLSLPTPPGAEHRDTAGESYLSCTRNNILYAAYAFSETAGDFYYQNGQLIAGAWTDATSVILMTPQGQGPQAIEAAAHMLKSFRFNQAWWERQFRTTVDVSQQIYGHAMDMLTTQSQDFDRAIRGVENYTNPVTGKKYEVPITDADNFAQNGAGLIVGIKGSQPPAGFTILDRAAPIKRK